MLKEKIVEYRRIKEKIELQEKKKRFWKDRAVAITSSIEGTPRTNEVSRKIEQCTLKLDELISEINSLTVELKSIELEIRVGLVAIQDPVQQSIVEYRVLECLPWQEIAGMLSYSLRWTQTLYNRALKNL